MEKIICIVCLEEKVKEDFNEEHVFPASMGGCIVIYNVCQDCNSRFGENIDTPLLDFPMVGVYRNQFQLARDKRRLKNISNPFQGIHKDKAGKKFRIFFEEGKVKAEALFDHEVIWDEDRQGHIINMTFPEYRKPDTEKLLKLIAKRNNLPYDNYIVENEYKFKPDELKITLVGENNSFIFGCLKIAYESTVNLFPFYLNDPYAAQFRKALLNVAFNHKARKILRNSQKLMTKYIKRFEDLTYLKPWEHAILIEFIKGVGLVCCVRIFNWVLPIIMSQNLKVLKPGDEILIHNDAKKRTYRSNVRQNFPTIGLTVEFVGVPMNVQEMVKEKRELAFVQKDGKHLLFNKNGEEMKKNLDDYAMHRVLRGNSESYWLFGKVHFDVSKEDLFLLTQEGEFIKLLKIDLTRQLVIYKLT